MMRVNNINQREVFGVVNVGLIDESDDEPPEKIRGCKRRDRRK